MPIYTYRCKDCGTVFDYLMLQSGEKPKCKKCGSFNLEKQVTTFAVRMGNNSGSSNSSCPTGTCPITGN